MDLRRSDRAAGCTRTTQSGEPHPFWISTDFQLYADNQPIFLSAPPCPSPGRPRCNRSPPAAPDGAATTASPPAANPPPRHFGEMPCPPPMHRMNPRIEARHRATSPNDGVDRLRRQRPVRDRAPPVDRPEHRPLHRALRSSSAAPRRRQPMRRAGRFWLGRRSRRWGMAPARRHHASILPTRVRCFCTNGSSRSCSTRRPAALLHRRPPDRNATIRIATSRV